MPGDKQRRSLSVIAVPSPEIALLAALKLWAVVAAVNAPLARADCIRAAPVLIKRGERTAGVLASTAAAPLGIGAVIAVVAAYSLGVYAVPGGLHHRRLKP